MNFPDFKVGWGGDCETAGESLIVLADVLSLNALQSGNVLGKYAWEDRRLLRGAAQAWF